MAVYESPNGVVFNLNRFVSFEVQGDIRSGPDPQESIWKLIGNIDRDQVLVLHSGAHAEAEAECRDELAKIRNILSRPFMVDLQHHTVNRLSR